MHSSLVLVTPSGMAPARLSRATEGVSTVATTPRRDTRPVVWGMPARGEGAARYKVWCGTEVAFPVQYCCYGLYPIILVKSFPQAKEWSEYNKASYCKFKVDQRTRPVILNLFDLISVLQLHRGDQIVSLRNLYTTR